jgi:integrase
LFFNALPSHTVSSLTSAARHISVPNSCQLSVRSPRRMFVPSLTDLSVRNLPPGLHIDTRLPSFGIRVGKSKKTWVVIKGKNRTKVSLGHYPAVSLHDARKKALAALASPEERARSTTLPFLDAMESFLQKQSATLRPLSLYQINRTLRRHFKWQKALNDITHDDVARALDAIAAPSERAHALKDLRTFFNWCIPRYIRISPCVGIKKPPQKSRDRVLDDDELGKVWRTAEAIGYPYGTIVQLLILTGQRSGEIAALQWDWIVDDTITIPASVTKNARATTFPIGPMTQVLIDTIPRLCPLLFPARGYTDRPFKGFGVSKIALDKCGVKNFTHHDLRRTFATNLAALGTPIHVTEKLLNHVSGTVSGVAAIYNRHAYLDEMRAAIVSWEKRLVKIAP